MDLRNRVDGVVVERVPYHVDQRNKLKEHQRSYKYTEMHKYGKILDGMDVVMSEVDTSVYTCCGKYRVVPEEVDERYRFCNYILDPNRHRLRTAVRCLALVMRFIRNTQRSLLRKKKLNEVEMKQSLLKMPVGLNDPEDGDCIVLTDQEMMLAIN